MLVCASSWALSCPQEGRQDTFGDSSAETLSNFPSTHRTEQNAALDF